MLRPRLATVVVTTAAFLLAAGSITRSFDRIPAPDFVAARDEVTKILAGFVRVDTNGVYYFMRWTPPQVNTAS